VKNDEANPGRGKEDPGREEEGEKGFRREPVLLRSAAQIGSWAA